MLTQAPLRESEDCNRTEMYVKVIIILSSTYPARKDQSQKGPSRSLLNFPYLRNHTELASKPQLSLYARASLRYPCMKPCSQTVSRYFDNIRNAVTYSELGLFSVLATLVKLRLQYSIALSQHASSYCRVYSLYCNFNPIVVQ